MLVENAVKHNIIANSKPLHIFLYAEGEDYIILENSYQPKASVTHTTNKGLENIAQRYALIFNREIQIEM
jgi:LytS/YehU family sensor histidine kinase